MYVFVIEYFRFDVTSNPLPILNQRYHLFVGGVPAETQMAPGITFTTTPFIGCLRDVLIETEIVDFNRFVE